MVHKIFTHLLLVREPHATGRLAVHDANSAIVSVNWIRNSDFHCLVTNLLVQQLKQ